MNIILKSLLFVGMLVSLQGNAQSPAERDFVALSWEISSPASNKYVDETSLAGWRIEYRKGIKDNLSVGVAMSWSAFDEYVNTKTYTTPDKTHAITTDMIRQVHTLPITLLGHYYFKMKSKVLEPYAGLGLGTQYSEHKAFLNIYELNETNWGFVARPELGTFFRFSPHSRTKALLSVGYNFSTNKNEAFDIDNWSQLTLNIGIGFGIQ